MFFEKLYNLIYHIGFTAGSGFMKFGKWLSRGLSRPVKTVGAVFFAVFLVIDKFILKTFKTVSAEFKLLMADIKRVSSGLNSLIHTDRKSAEAKLRIYIKKAFSRHGIVFTFAVNLLVPIICLGVLCSTIGYWNKACSATRQSRPASMPSSRPKQGSKPLRLPPVRSRSLLSLRSISSRS